MPIEKKITEDENEETGLSQPLLSTGASGTITGAGGTGGTEEKPLTPQDGAAGNNVADIGKYLDANREKAKGLATNVGGLVSGNITGAKDQLGQAQTQFEQDVDKGTVKFDQELFDKGQAALTNPNAAVNIQGSLVNTPPPAPPTPDAQDTTLAPTPPAPAPYTSGDASNFLADYGDAFKDQYNAQYGGPQNILEQDYFREAQKATQGALRDVDLTGTETGRQELIARSRQESGRINRGILALDQALLSRDPEAMAILEEATAGSPELKQKLEDLKTLGVELVEAGKKTTAETRGKFRDEFSVNREVEEIEQAYKLLKDDLKVSLENRLKEVEAMADVEGVKAGMFFDKNFGQLQNLNKYNVASVEDIERLKALEQLTGIQSGFSPYAELAGTSQDFLDPNLSFDKASYDATVNMNRQNRLAREEQARIAKDMEKQAKEAQGQQAGTLIGAGVGSGIGYVVGGPVGGYIGAAVGGAIGGAIGCFEATTPIEMQDGSFKQIKDIELGDITAHGGEVTSVIQHKFEDGIFAYPTPLLGYICVTGFHAVIEDGVWIRVKDSKKALKLSREDLEVNRVYAISNKNHRLKIGGQIFADDDELDNGRLYSFEESLRILNQMEKGEMLESR